jgi:acyl-CoA thioester hydrolase
MLTTIVTPRFGDVDGLRHINNTKLPEWFELARSPLYLYFNDGYDFDNWNLIMARISVDFVRPMVLGHDIEIRTFLLKIGNSSFTTGHEAWQEGQLCVRGDAVLVHYDFANEQSLPIPEDIRARLEEHLLPAPA